MVNWSWLGNVQWYFLSIYWCKFQRSNFYNGIFLRFLVLMLQQFCSFDCALNFQVSVLQLWQSFGKTYLAPNSSRLHPPKSSFHPHKQENPHNLSPCHSHLLLICKGLFPLHCSTDHYLSFATWYHSETHMDERKSLKYEKQFVVKFGRDFDNQRQEGGQYLAKHQAGVS